jgi:hypothetical protein
VAAAAASSRTKKGHPVARGGLKRCAERLQYFFQVRRRFETDGPARADGDYVAGLGIDPFARFTRAHRESAKTGNLKSIPLDRLDNSIEGRVHRFTSGALVDCTAPATVSTKSALVI